MEDLQEIIDYVEKHIQNKLNLKELSDFMGYSSFYISRKFMDIYGIPLTAFVRIRKLQYSIKDLIKLNFPMKFKLNFMKTILLK